MVEFILAVVGIYAVIGVVIGVLFAFSGAKKVDAGAVEGTWGFKLLIIPGAAALWPLVLKRWVKGEHPTECSAHRRAAAAAMRQ